MSHKSRTILIGYDRRFLAPELAEAICAAVRGCELEPLLTETPVVTPACSCLVVQKKLLGALVVTASHNPPEWIGLKIKCPFGGSVDSEFTHSVEQRLVAGGITIPVREKINKIDARQEHLDVLRKNMSIDLISIPQNGPVVNKETGEQKQVQMSILEWDNWCKENPDWTRDWSDPSTLPGFGEVGDFKDKLKKSHPGWNDVLHKVSKAPGSYVRPT